ncbi:MAG TPA: RNA-binding S4 domain-containing protein [Clostridiaceae bacterium]
MNEIKIKTEIIKLDSFLKWAGLVGSGAEGKLLINDGKVKLNGEIETQRGKKLKAGDVIEFLGEKYNII